MAKNGRDDLLKAFVSRGKNRRVRQDLTYRPLPKRSAMPRMEDSFKSQARLPRVKASGTYKPAKRNQRIARY